ncbi:MAG: hypothetical protein KC619_32170 [Myxococcales bacterium]|nr:hypothetical protein [Myxococcales bacterium]
MTNATDTFEGLRSLLSEAGVSVRFGSERPAPASLTDPAYHVCVFAVAVSILGRRENVHQVIDERLLRFGQFIATRPVLLADVQNAAKRWPRGAMPSGYATEPTILATLQYLAASGGVTRREGLLWAPITGPLMALASQIRVAEMFATEVNVLETLADLSITKKSLGEW